MNAARSLFALQNNKNNNAFATDILSLRTIAKTEFKLLNFLDIDS